MRILLSKRSKKQNNNNDNRSNLHIFTSRKLSLFAATPSQNMYAKCFCCTFGSRVALIHTISSSYVQSPAILFVRSFDSLFNRKRKPKRKSVNVKYLPFSLQCWLLFVYGMCAGCKRTMYIHILYIYTHRDILHLCLWQYVST